MHKPKYKSQTHTIMNNNRHHNQEPFAKLQIVSRHLTTTSPPTYAVRKELVLPGSDTFENLIDTAREKYRVAFTDDLNTDQRSYHIALDLFKWPSTIYLGTPNTRVYKSKYHAGIDILISGTHVPKKIFLQLEYDFRYWMAERLPKIIRVHLDGTETLETNLDPNWDAPTSLTGGAGL